MSGPISGDPLHRTPPWAPLLAPLLLVVVARQAAVPLTDPDSFWHLRLGSVLLNSRSLDTPDWSTSDDRTWTLTQWLPEMVTAQVDEWFGLPGVMWVFGLSLILLTFAVYFLARPHAGILASAFVTGLALVAMSASISPRPHMVTYIFLAVTVGAWVRAADSLRAPWWLVPLTWVWAMCHGMWFVGPIVGLAVCLGLAIDRTASRQQLSRLFAVPLLCIVAAALTPIGPKLLLAPVAVGGVGAFITEWQAPSFRSVGPAAAALMLLIVVGSWARASRPIRWPRIVLMVVAAGWILLAVRTVTLGAIILVPLVATEIQSWLQQRPGPGTRREWVSMLGTGLAALVVLAFVVPHTSAEPGKVPSDLNSALDDLPGESAIINSYALGGWLRWEHPHLDPLIDGLTEAYTVAELQDYGLMTAVARGWDEEVAEIDAEAALLPEDSPLAVALEDRLGWRVIDTDAGYVLLQRP